MGFHSPLIAGLTRAGYFLGVQKRGIGWVPLDYPCPHLRFWAKNEVVKPWIPAGGETGDLIGVARSYPQKIQEVAETIIPTERSPKPFLRGPLVRSQSIFDGIIHQTFREGT